jgi:hypothetical protein
MSCGLALNPFSQRFADGLFAAHPEWSPLAQRDPQGFPPPGSLYLSVPSPVAGRALLIKTYGDQVTVDFGSDGWHEHFIPAAYVEGTSACTAALRFIDDLLADRRVIATRHLFGHSLWATPLVRTLLSSVT